MVPAYLMESLQDGRVCMYIFEQKYTLYKMTSHFGVLKLIYYKMGGFPPSNHYKMDLENPVYMGLDSSPFYRGNFYEDLLPIANPFKIKTTPDWSLWEVSDGQTL